MRTLIALMAGMVLVTACAPGGVGRGSQEDEREVMVIDWDLSEGPDSAAVDWDELVGAERREVFLRGPIDATIKTSVGTFEGRVKRLGMQRREGPQLLTVDLRLDGGGMSVLEALERARELGEEWSLPMDNFETWAGEAAPLERAGRWPPVTANTNSTVIGPDGARVSLRTVSSPEERERSVELTLTIFWPEQAP